MAAATLLVRNRYDVRGALLAWSMALRLAAIAIGASMGFMQTIHRDRDCAAVSTVSVSAVGLNAFRRWPQVAASSAGLGSHSRPLVRAPVDDRLGASRRCAASCRPCWSGWSRAKSQIANFRVAQAPQRRSPRCRRPCGSCCSRSSRDVEHGRGDRAFRLLRRYIATTALLSCVFVPILWFATPWLVRLRRATRPRTPLRVMLPPPPSVRLRLDRRFPVSIGRGPRLRTAGAAAPSSDGSRALVVVLADAYGATGAQPGSSGSSLVLAAFWTISLVRLPLQATMLRRDDRVVNALVVSGIWPPDVGGPAETAPEWRPGWRPRPRRSRRS
jgi:hypothetical protein